MPIKRILIIFIWVMNAAVGQAQYKCDAGQFMNSWYNNIGGSCGPAPTGIPYPPSQGLAYFDGSAWGTPYGTSGTGTVLALTASPTFTGTVNFTNLVGGIGSNVTSYLFTSGFGSMYGTLRLGSGTGGTIEKSYNDGTPVVVSSIMGSTSATGDYYDTKDAGGTLHTIVDNALGVHGTTFNSVAITNTGSGTNVLYDDGSYKPLPTVGSGFPIILGTTSIAAGSTNTALLGMTSISLTGPTANSGTNYNSGSLAFTGSFNDGGPVNQTWVAINLMGQGLTPTSTFSISPIPGGTTGSRIFQVSADEEILENGAGIVHVTGNSAYMGVSATGVSVGPSDVTITGTAASGNVYLSPGATGSVIASRPVRMPVASFVNGGSTINLNAPGGGTGVFNQNVTAENGDLQPCPTGTPTVAAGAAAGTGAAISVLGTNCGGVITLKTGSATTSQATVFTLTFSNPFTHYGFCTSDPMPVTLQDPGITPDNVGMQTAYNDHFQLILVGGEAAMSPLSNHQWSYTCNGY